VGHMFNGKKFSSRLIQLHVSSERKEERGPT